MGVELKTAAFFTGHNYCKEFGGIKNKTRPSTLVIIKQ